jgi:hypothetical protein
VPLLLTLTDAVYNTTLGLVLIREDQTGLSVTRSTLLTVFNTGGASDVAVFTGVPF